jgi:hypothetical protein
MRKEIVILGYLARLMSCAYSDKSRFYPQRRSATIRTPLVSKYVLTNIDLDTKLYGN